MGSFKIKGLDGLQKELKKLEKDVADTVKKYDGTQIGFDKLFPPKFMNQHTKFSDFDLWISAGGFKFKNQEEFDALPEEKLDAYVAQSTDFDSWQDMLDTSGAEMLQEELGW